MSLLFNTLSRFCNPMDCSPLGSSVHGILQAKILEWAAIHFSRGSSWPRDQICISCIAGRFFFFFFNHLSHQGNPVSLLAFMQTDLFLEHKLLHVTCLNFTFFATQFICFLLQKEFSNHQRLGSLFFFCKFCGTLYIFPLYNTCYSTIKCDYSTIKCDCLCPSQCQRILEGRVHILFVAVCSLPTTVPDCIYIVHTQCVCWIGKLMNS